MLSHGQFGAFMTIPVPGIRREGQMKIIQIPNHINANDHKEPCTRHKRRLQQIANNWLEKTPTHLISTILSASSRFFPNILQDILNNKNGRYSLTNKTRLSVQQTSVVVSCVQLTERQCRKLKKMQIFYTGKHFLCSEKESLKNRKEADTSQVPLTGERNY